MKFDVPYNPKILNNKTESKQGQKLSINNNSSQCYHKVKQFKP